MENTRINEQLRRTQLKAEEIELFKNSFVIVPYRVSGYINFTNQGYNLNNVNPEEFETFKRIWTGNDACIITWKGCVELHQNPETLEPYIKWKLGDVFLGQISYNSNENRILTDTSFTDYKSQDVKKSVSFYVNADKFELNDEYLFMFYKIPEYSKSTLFRLVNIEKDFVGKKLVAYILTFETINQDLANTGRARQQNIMPNAPGQGYLECVVKDSNWIEEIGEEEFNKLEEGKDYYKFYDRYITADFTKTRNNPVRKAVVRLFGNAILCSLVFLGRPAKYGYEFENYSAQRLIFPTNFSYPTTPNLLHSQTNNNNMYFGEFTPVLEYWKELMDSIKDSITPVNKWNYQGWLTYSYNDLKKTNQLFGNSGTYENSLYGTTKVSSSEVYQTQWEFEINSKKIDTTGVYGLGYKYIINGNKKKLENHFWDNFWTQKMIKFLPQNITQTLTFGWTIGSSLSFIKSGSIGGIVSGCLLGLVGISATLISKLKAKNFQSFRGLINAPFIDFNNGQFKITDDNKNKIPFDLLNSDENSPSSIFFDSKTLQTSFEVELTDMFVSSDVDNEKTILNTSNIGQNTFEDGTYIFESKETFLVNGNEKLVPRSGIYGDTHDGYIIDGFKIQAVFGGEIEINFLDKDDDVVWNGVYQSEGKWTSSLREIWTEKNTSIFNRENMFITEPLPYPKNIYTYSVDLPTGYYINSENNNSSETGLSYWYFSTKKNNKSIDKIIEKDVFYFQDYKTGCCYDLVVKKYNFLKGMGINEIRILFSKVRVTYFCDNLVTRRSTYGVSYKWVISQKKIGNINEDIIFSYPVDDLLKNKYTVKQVEEQFNYLPYFLQQKSIWNKKYTYYISDFSINSYCFNCYWAPDKHDVIKIEGNQTKNIFVLVFDENNKLVEIVITTTPVNIDKFHGYNFLKLYYNVFIDYVFIVGYSYGIAEFKMGLKSYEFVLNTDD